MVGEDLGTPTLMRTGGIIQMARGQADGVVGGGFTWRTAPAEAPSGSAPGAGTRPWRLAASISLHSNLASALLLTVQPGKGNQNTKPQRALIRKLRRRAVKAWEPGSWAQSGAWTVRGVGGGRGSGGVPPRSPQSGAPLTQLWHSRWLPQVYFTEFQRS